MACITYSSSKIIYKKKEYTRQELLDMRSNLCGDLTQIDVDAIQGKLLAKTVLRVDMMRSNSQDLTPNQVFNSTLNPSAMARNNLMNQSNASLGSQRRDFNSTL